MTLHLEEVEIVSLLKQVRCELADKIEKSGVDFRFQLPEEKYTFIWTVRKPAVSLKTSW